MQDLFDGLIHIQRARTLRASSYDTTGRNDDAWRIPRGQSAVLCDLTGPGKITHIWMTQSNPDADHLRKVTLKIYWDGEAEPSVWVPLGDFFCLGHGMVNSFQSLFFTASAQASEHFKFGGLVALNAYLPMPFRRGARVEICNESDGDHTQYFYIDYELYPDPLPDDVAYLHACFRRENPTDGWGHEVEVHAAETFVANLTDARNYLLLEAEGEGHFLGFNLSVTNLQHGARHRHERTWWGEGDDMIFIDGEPWPPSLHGTGSEDALHQAYGMQPNAYLFNGSSIFEGHTQGYQSSYVFYGAHPVRFAKQIRASIEHGHGNHLSNEYSSVAYWYQREPHRAFGIVPAAQRIALVRSFAAPEGNRTAARELPLTEEMRAMKARWAERRGE